MKSYGSRFCRKCGQLFQLAEPGTPTCGTCESPATDVPRPGPGRSEPIGTGVSTGPGHPDLPRSPAPAARPPAPRKPRVPRPRQTAAGANAGPVTGQRTLPMLRALAAAPRGLTTPQLAEFASSATSWVNALGTTRQLMLKQERLGRVTQAGVAPGNRTRGSVLWRITAEGERYVRDHTSETGSRTSGADLTQALPARPAGRRYWR